MRILVLSDSHRSSSVLKKIIEKHSDIKNIFFLGDNTDDIEIMKDCFPDRKFYIVSGNCDFSFHKSYGIETIENTRIYYCHGHRLGVKYSTENLLNTAKENNCQIALFGHTHKSLCAYFEGVYLVNPGSCALSRDGANSYAVIDITKSGIMPNIILVK